MFSSERKSHHLQELALASIVVMTTGKTYIHTASNIVLDTQELLIPHLWYEYLLYTATPPEESLLISHDTTIQKEIRDLSRNSTPVYPLVTVGYDERMENFYETFHPEWKKLPCSEDVITGFVLKYRLARTKTDEQVHADLLFSEPQQAYTINTNELLQMAIGIALTVKEQDDVFPPEIRSATFDCGGSTTHHSSGEREPVSSIYCLSR